MKFGPVFGVDGRRGTSAKAPKASKGAGARISSDFLATPPVPKFAPSGKNIYQYSLYIYIHIILINFIKLINISN